MSSTTARRLPILAPVNFSKRRAPSCERVKLVSQRPGESASVPARALRMSCPVITGVRLTRYQPPEPLPAPAGQFENLGVERQNAALGAPALLPCVFHGPSFFTSTIFELGGGADELLDVRRVVHARQLHQNFRLRVRVRRDPERWARSGRERSTRRSMVSTLLRHRVPLQIDQRAGLHVQLVVGGVDRASESSPGYLSATMLRNCCVFAWSTPWMLI